MPDTANLSLPLLAAAQAQKHVTHNEALQAVDALLQCAVLDRDLADPPSSPVDGARYLVASPASGSWAGHDGEIAAWQGGAWSFHEPQAGFLVYAVDEAVLLLHDGTGFGPATPAALQNLVRLGLGTAADAANPFAAKLNGALWTARASGEGGTGDLRYTLNKESTARVLSLLFQSAYSGRAELGLIGDDDVQLKVSADGSSWTEALRATPGGKIGLGTATPAERLSVAGNIAPAADNAHSLGTSSLRFSAVYAATGVINTSDLRRKRHVEQLEPALALSLLGAAPPISFQWEHGGSDEVETPDGPVLRRRAGRRRHYGWSAQDWAIAMERLGQDAGLLVRLDPADPESELALRPDQVTAVLHAAVNGLSAEIGTLTERVNALESRATPA